MLKAQSTRMVILRCPREKKRERGGGRERDWGGGKRERERERETEGVGWGVTWNKNGLCENILSILKRKGLECCSRKKGLKGFSSSSGTARETVNTSGFISLVNSF